MSADFENNYFPSIVLIVISLTDIIKQCDYVFVRVRTLPTKLEDTRGKERDLECMYSNRSLEFFRIHI
jgi:hypothetical protein